MTVVSKMRISLTVAGELELARFFFITSLKRFRATILRKANVNRFGAGSDTEEFRGPVCEMGVYAD